MKLTTAIKAFRFSPLNLFRSKIPAWIYLRCRVSYILYSLKCSHIFLNKTRKNVLQYFEIVVKYFPASRITYFYSFQNTLFTTKYHRPTVPDKPNYAIKTFFKYSTRFQILRYFTLNITFFHELSFFNSVAATRFQALDLV